MTFLEFLFGKDEKRDFSYPPEKLYSRRYYITVYTEESETPYEMNIVISDLYDPDYISKPLYKPWALDESMSFKQLHQELRDINTHGILTAGDDKEKPTWIPGRQIKKIIIKGNELYEKST